MDGIKVTFEEKKVAEKSEYPCFKIAEGHDGSPTEIVFFIDETAGYCVTNTSWHKAGQYSDNWSEDSFTPFHGTITIEVE